MEEITITQDGFNERYIEYLYEKIKERFSFLPGSCEMRKDGNTYAVAFSSERAYLPYVRKFTEGVIADVVTIGYKYTYFQKNLRVPLLSPFQKHVLCTAIVSADYKEDRKFALQRVHGYADYSLDGLFYFRLQELQERWKGVMKYVSVDMNTEALQRFLEFLTEDGVGKIFIKGENVYDEEYRLLTRSHLTGKGDVLGEILLGNAERVYCFGNVSLEVKEFLKRYYPSKVVFC